jgi:hypothetical protein
VLFRNYTIEGFNNDDREVRVLSEEAMNGFYTCSQSAFLMWTEDEMRQVYGLLQGESAVVSGFTVTRHRDSS